MAVLFGDERCVAPDDPESNYGMARSELLDRVFPGSVHRVAGADIRQTRLPHA